MSNDERKRVSKYLTNDDIYDFDPKYDRVKSLIKKYYHGEEMLTSDVIRLISRVSGIHDYDETSIIVTKVLDELSELSS